ncbi:MAG: hypothetical protein JWP08_1917 [Bryobacterales bacterium]|nr:hypothetical protein [Bryobacterales bacterium]
MDISRPEAKSFKQLTISVEKLPASMGRQAKISAYATERARLLLGCYRTGDANDPETYVAAIAAMLAHYPEQIITDVTHPVSGLPAQKSWLPTVKEVRDACEEIVERDALHEARQQRIREQLANRAREDADKDDRSQRPSYDALKEKYGAAWGIGQPHSAAGFKTGQAPAVADLRAHYAKHDLQFKPKQAAE